jgi:hypothetical protein
MPRCALPQADPYAPGGFVRRSGWLAGFLALFLSGCDYLPWYPEGREDPVAVARGFIAAARRGDCKEAWSYFSEQTREKIRQQSQRAVRSAPRDSLVHAPHRMQCSPYEAYRPATVELVANDSVHATIGVMERVPAQQSFSGSGWNPTGRTDAKRIMELIHESDGWKILPELPLDPGGISLPAAVVAPGHQTNQ